jgi:hypothetical protein
MQPPRNGRLFSLGLSQKKSAIFVHISILETKPLPVAL